MSSGPAWIRPGLLLSSASSERDACLLGSLGVTHILQCGVELAPSHAAQQGAFTYLSLPLLDVVEQDLLSSLPAAFAFMEAAFDAGGCVLVHCAAGISRSASVVIGYLMHSEGLGADAATAVVVAARPVACPNPGFALQLRQYEAAGRDVAAWQQKGPWCMERYLSDLCGRDSCEFIAGVLGSAPPDRVALHSAAAAAHAAKQQEQQQQHAAGSCAAAASTANGCCSSPSSIAPSQHHHHHHHHGCSSASDTQHIARLAATSSSRYAAAAGSTGNSTAALYGVSPPAAAAAATIADGEGE